MGFRITTNMMMNTYRYNLQNSTKKRADSSDKMLTQRNFNSYAEDPAAATQAFRLRREWYQTQNQITNTKDVYSKFNTAHNNIQGMLDDLINPMEKVSVIQGNNDTTGEARKALAQVLRETAESMVQGFNQQLGDHFIFSGNDGLNAPFEWKGEDLYYRGINVKAGQVCKPTAPEPTWLSDWKVHIDNLSAHIEANPNDPNIEALTEQRDSALSWYKYYNHEGEKPEDGVDADHYLNAIIPGGGGVAGTTGKDAEWAKYYLHQEAKKPTAEEPAWAASGTPPTDKYGVPTDMPLVGATEMDSAWIAYYKDQGDLAKLKEMSEEEMYIDLGMGAQEKGANNPVRGTYFNSALSALNYTDFGVDQDGDPKNFAILMRELADVFETWDEDMEPTPGYNPELAKNSAAGLTGEELQAKAYRLMDKLKAAQETLTADHVELNARSTFLQTNQERLELQASELNTEILDIEQVDLAEAISGFSWDMYCYNAALKIGNQLLSQSLIDYMR